MSVMKPWTPLSVKESDDEIAVKVFERTYTAGEASFLSSLTSKGRELLAAPVRLVVREDGVERRIEGGYRTFLMEGATDEEAELLAAAESEQFLVNTAMHVEFDGFCDIRLTVAPRGRNVAQLFGFESLKPYDYRLDRLHIEIPLRREAARYFQFYPQLAGHHVLECGGELQEALSLPFREQVFLTGEDVGLLTFFESEEGFAPLGRENAIEVIPEGDTVLLRIRLLDEEPAAWQSAVRERMDLDPISFRFGIMATPVKPMPAIRFEERAVHIDCYKKILEDYEDFLAAPFGDTGEVTYDRLRRLGVNTLYIHEKWNDLQNSPLLTTRTARRLRTIISECHARGIKVIPYFGYEMSSLAPNFYETRNEYWRYSKDSCRGAWYRQPPQRDIRVCRKSSFSEFFVEGVARLMDEYGFDGIYLDGTAYAAACMNGAHGCGFTDAEGKRHPTYPVYGTRRIMKLLHREIVEKRGGIINCHAGSAFNMPALSFATSLWDGEVFQTIFLHGRIAALPDAYFRALYTGRNIGVPIYMLTYCNPPVWDFHMALSTALPFGIIPKTNDAGEPLEEMAAIWRAYDAFGVGDAEWIPYYAGEDIGASVSDERVLVSAYRHEGRLLLILATEARELKADFTLTSRYPHLTNAITGETLSTNGVAELSLRGFDHLLLVADDGKE